MCRQSPSRVRVFLALGTVSVALAVWLVYEAHTASVVVFWFVISIPLLAIGGGLIGAGAADGATDGTNRPLRMVLVALGAFAGGGSYPLVVAVVTGAVPLDSLDFVEGYAPWGLALAVVAVTSIEVLVWESRGRPR